MPRNGRAGPTGWFRVVKLRETEEDKRLRHVACLPLRHRLARASGPPRRRDAELIINGNFGSISHQGRAFVALSVFYRLRRPQRGKRAAGADPSIGAAGDGGAGPFARRRIPRRAFDLGGAPGRVARDPFPAAMARKLMSWCSSTGWSIWSPTASAGRFKQLARLVGRSGSIVRR